MATPSPFLIEAAISNLWDLDSRESSIRSHVTFPALNSFYAALDRFF